MSTISRYLLRETFGMWLIVVGVLFLILMTNQFAEILADAAAERLPRDSLFAIFALTSLRFLMMLTPIGLFLGVLLALARLNRDCEMAALAACGVGPGRLLVPVLTLTTGLALALAWLALVQTPAANARIEAIQRQAARELKLGALQPGRFTSPDAGGTVLYPREVSGDQLLDLFVERREGDRVITILADRGERVVDPATGELSFVLHDGRLYEGVPGENEFLVVDFAKQLIPVRESAGEEVKQAAANKSTAALLASRAPEDRAELQWRISLPISVFVLALLAVPLSRAAPREGRYARLGIGLLGYITYANLLSIAQVWVERQIVPEWAGMWWVHGVVGGIAVLLLVRQSGVFVSPAPPARAAAAS